MGSLIVKVDLERGLDELVVDLEAELNGSLKR